MLVNLRNLFAAASAALLIGCQGDIPIRPAATAASAHFDGNGSWIARTSSGTPLIYNSCCGEYSVYIYDYAGDQLGELKGLSGVHGLCSDQNGDVYVTAGGIIYEYQRGGSLPINVIDERPEGANSCAVDPTTGNLALANGGDIAIFPPGSFQYPISYTNPNINSYSFCSYDSAGNLYVDGTGAKNSFQFGELPKGGSQIVSIPLAGLNNHNHRAGGVQWDGQDVAIADALAHVIYRIAVSGSNGQVVKTIHLSGWRRHAVIEFSVVGKKLIFPLSPKMLFFRYPQGGRPRTGFVNSHVGDYVTVSLPQ